jgi:hypothetical protein
MRPVPLVRIDFGNGTVVTRTLHGNIATYACTADGQVLDVVPGIYAPAPYLDALRQLRMLANYVDQKGPAERLTRLRDYHQRQAEHLKKDEAVARFINLADMSKAKIEGRIKAVMVSGGKIAPTANARQAKTEAQPEEPRLDSKEDLSSWKTLTLDTKQNETQRRRQIHEMLAAAGAVKPAAVAKRLYKEVLHADVDDPYLGLGKVLFTNYAFAKEDNGK